MTREEIITCLQALSRIEGATFEAQNKTKKLFIWDNIAIINNALLKQLNYMDTLVDYTLFQKREL